MNQLASAPLPVEQPVLSPAGAHPGGAPLDDLFSSEEWQQLHAQDKLAGGAIVAIMIAIFSLGLIGYLFIAFVCAGG